MTEHKTDMNITEKLNSTSTAEYKTDMNMTEKLSSTFTEHNYTLVNQTINIRECLQVVLTRLSDFMIAIKVLLTCSTLFLAFLENFRRIFVSSFDKVV